VKNPLFENMSRRVRMYRVLSCKFTRHLYEGSMTQWPGRFLITKHISKNNRILIYFLKWWRLQIKWHFWTRAPAYNRRALIDQNSFVFLIGKETGKNTNWEEQKKKKHLKSFPNLILNRKLNELQNDQLKVQ